MIKNIDFTQLPIGNTTTKVTDGKMNRVIQKCPVCEKNGAYVKYFGGDRAYTHTASLTNIKSGTLAFRTLTLKEQCFIPKTSETEGQLDV